jgi:uncharacterized protein YqhQ
MENIGGQAVIEGVMMKSRKGWTVAVRGPKGDIHVKREALKNIPKIFKLPVLRGAVALYEALSIGIRAIEFSARKAYEEEDTKPTSPLSLGLTIVVAIILGIAVFIVLPLYATKLLGILSPSISKSSLLFNLVDGIIRIILFLAYLAAVGTWKEMRRIFEYHGAEHKVIHAYENNKGLIPKEIKDYSPHHPRCGTSFLLIVMVVSILTFSLIPQDWSFTNKFLSRLILIPAIAGFSFEFLKLSFRMKNNPLINILIQPGLQLQRLTTREPDDDQIEVAIKALEEVLKIEELYARKT